jgi:D-3-phosphoglycerate dehydrogenase / 2-oxoglutarate reductase
MTRILLAGDHFVRNDLLRHALEEEVDPARLDLVELVLPWPIEPFGQVAEVDEASGTEEQLIKALDGVEICLTQMAAITRRVLAAAPSLRLVCVGRGGPVNVNLEAATAAGVAVCSAPGRNATSTAEHTVALMLAALRAIPRRDAELRAGKWRSDYYQYDEVGPELAGCTVGLVGCGAIGLRVARILRAFGARIVVYDPYADEAALADVGERVDTVAELISRSLVVTVHARLTEQTAGIVGREQLAAMPPGGVLINAARGGLVDYDAVCDALAEGRLGAAAFDVFPEEPLPADSRLRSFANVVMTPHLAGASKQTAMTAAAMMAAEVRRHLTGEPLQHLANPR